MDGYYANSKSQMDVWNVLDHSGAFSKNVLSAFAFELFNP